MAEDAPPESMQLTLFLQIRQERKGPVELTRRMQVPIAEGTSGLRSAVKEITQIYADLRHRGLDIRYLDVGGGLGVNYGAGYAGTEDTAVNYALTEYANAVVYAVQEICAAREVPEPVLVSESGRALTAHHSVLVVPALAMLFPILVLLPYSLVHSYQKKKALKEVLLRVLPI